jgi:hypothetical protein
VFTPTPPTDLTPQGHRSGGSHKATLEEDTGFQRTNPKTGEAQNRGVNGIIPSPTRLSAGGADYMAGRTGPLRGEWGLSFLLSVFFFFSVPFSLTHTEKQTPISQTTFSHISPPTHIHTHNYSVCLSGFPHFPFPTPLKCSGIWRRQPCPTQRCQKWGLDFWTRGHGPRPLCIPTPGPSRRLYYLICSSS